MKQEGRTNEIMLVVSEEKRGTFLGFDYYNPTRNILFIIYYHLYIYLLLGFLSSFKYRLQGENIPVGDYPIAKKIYVPILPYFYFLLIIYATFNHFKIYLKFIFII